MKVYGMSAISDFLDDFIVYRNLVPVDARLPSIKDLRASAGTIPRKNETDYARVVAKILKYARRLTAPGVDIRRVIFLGDTRLLDSTAFANICFAGGWPGIGFIGSENGDQAKVEIEALSGGRQLFVSNRWSHLDDAFREFVAAQGFPIDEHTALLIDLDKTALGARGRNAATIDNARVQAVFATVAALLGKHFNAPAFRSAYDLIIQPEFHPFTEDNQDNVAYICLLLGSGLYQLDTLINDVRSGALKTFQQFIGSVEQHKNALLPALQNIHAEIFANVRAGDPTPFKSFRYNEYRITVSLMGHLAGETPVEKLLSAEIVITREVRDLALAWKTQGALVFGLSDKPDEASIPTPGLAAQGFAPLHRQQTHVVGE